MFQLICPTGLRTF